MLQISKSLIVSNTNNVVNSLVSTVVQDNSIYTMSNTVTSAIIAVSNISCFGDVNISTVNQANNVTAEVANKIITAVTTNVDVNIKTTINNIVVNQQPPPSMIDNIMATNLAELQSYNATNLANIARFTEKLRNAGSAMPSGMFGSSHTENIDDTANNDISSLLSLDSSAVSKSLSNLSSTNDFKVAVNNLVKMINKISAQNIINVASLACTGSFNISSIDQVSNIKATFINQFNSNIINNISVKVISDITNTYKSLYNDIATASANQPDSKTLAQINLLETMSLGSMYAVATGTTPDAIKLRCQIQARLIMLGGPKAPKQTPECVGVNLNTDSNVTESSNNIMTSQVKDGGSIEYSGVITESATGINNRGNQGSRLLNAPGSFGDKPGNVANTPGNVGNTPGNVGNTSGNVGNTPGNIANGNGNTGTNTQVTTLPSTSPQLIYIIIGCVIFVIVIVLLLKK